MAQETVSVLVATQRSIAAASHLTSMDAGAVETLLRLAAVVDELDERPRDNVTVPTYLKFCGELGLTPAGRARLDPEKEAEGGQLAKLRAIPAVSARRSS